MRDLLYVSVVIIFFLLTSALLAACASLTREG